MALGMQGEGLSSSSSRRQQRNCSVLPGNCLALSSGFFITTTFSSAMQERNERVSDGRRNRVNHPFAHTSKQTANSVAEAAVGTAAGVVGSSSSSRFMSKVRP